jgi:Ca-activated chloride channel family protein
MPGNFAGLSRLPLREDAMNTLSRSLLLAVVLLLAACANEEKEPGQGLSQPESHVTSASPISAESESGLFAESSSGQMVQTPAKERPAQAHDNAAGAASPRRESRVAVAPMAPPPMAAPAPNAYMQGVMPDREQYAKIDENSVRQVAESPVSTFSIDVDTGSYTNVRRMLNAGRLPPADAVRVEEMVNYFPYAYALPRGNAPFSVHTEIAPAPWNAQHHLLRIGIKAQDVAKASLPPANLVFLVDVSGSMMPPERLPLLKSSLRMLVAQLRPQDHVSLVTYASGTRVVLEPTSGADKRRIMAALDDLRAGGSTNGAGGITLAYQMAERGYIKGGINRILLATDGDFNVGMTNFESLKNLVEEKRRGGVSLSTLGFGVGNYNDRLMEQLADAGNGNYSYIDTLNEGRKVLVNEMTSTLATVAKDVKIQIEFNPDEVLEYRLIGYENRKLKREDFNNDKVDAGEVGAGHTVTALYEITLKGHAGSVEPLRYGGAGGQAHGKPGELAFVRLRYKAPDGDVSRLAEWPLYARNVKQDFYQATSEFRFAVAVAAFGQQLRGGKYTGNMGYEDIFRIAAASLGEDPYGYRREFLQLVRQAQALSAHAPGVQPGNPDIGVD